MRVEVWTESRIKEERLGGLLGVGQGSAQPTRLVYATYDPDPTRSCRTSRSSARASRSTQAGSRSRPAEGMMTMKTDMTGAADRDGGDSPSRAAWLCA